VTGPRATFSGEQLGIVSLNLRASIGGGEDPGEHRDDLLELLRHEA
jgi:hypothetical protein